MTATSRVAAFLAREGRRRRSALFLSALGAAIAAAAATLLLGLSGWFLAGAALAGAAGPLAVQGFNYLLPSAGLRAFAIARTAGRYGERLFGHQAAFRALAALRPALFAGLAAASPEHSLQLASGEGSARLVQDVDAVETEFVRRSAPWAAGAAATSAAVAIALAAPWAAAVFLIGLAAQIGLARRLASRWTADSGRDALSATGQLKTSLNAYAAAAAELTCFNLTDAAVRAVMAHDAALGAAQLEQADAEATLALIQAGVVAATLVGVAALSMHAPLPLAALALLAALAGLDGVEGLLRAAEQQGGYRAAVARLDAMVGDASPSPAAQAPAAALVLDGHSLEPGTRAALIGPSGSGKTRTLEALIGLRRAPPGRFMLGATPLETLPIGSARTLFAYAPQDARLLTGTIAENLRLAAPASADDALWEALTDAQLADRVRTLPLGLGAWIGDGGEKLSGGERKRLSLARAYLSDAPWMLLDEPTEGLDAATEASVVEALARRLNRTGQGALIISHRASPLTLCTTTIEMRPRPTL